MKEDIGQVKVCVPIKDLWKAMVSDMRHMVPKVLPDLVEEVELLEGDGGYGSMLGFKFRTGVPRARYQREKIVELDESLHLIALEMVEGGHLDLGFSSYTNVFKFTQVSEAETLIEVKVFYETKPEYTEHVPGETLKTTFEYIKCFENYLLNDVS